MASPLSLFSTSALDAALITTAPSAPLPYQAPTTQAVVVSTDPLKPDYLSSAQANAFFSNALADLRALYAAGNYNDAQIAALQNKGSNALTNISASLDRLEDQVQATKDLQVGYNQGYTLSTRVNFIDSHSIEQDQTVVGSSPLAYDARLQAISLPYTSRDMLHNSSGNAVVDVSLDLQLGVPQPHFSAFRSPDLAVDNNPNSYWGETVLVNDQVRMPWPGVGSPYAGSLVRPITSGAVCEYTISFRQPSDFTTISLAPYCEFPINLAAVFVIKRDSQIQNSLEVNLGSVSTGYSRYLITEYNSARKNGLLYLNQTERLFFSLQESVTSITLVFHQPHYTREVYSVSARSMVNNSMWQQMLGNAQIGALNAYDPMQILPALDTALGINATGSTSLVQYQYVYGAYDIGVYDKQYQSSGSYISTPIPSTENILQGSLIADQDLPMVYAQISSSAFGTVPSSWAIPAATITYSMAVDGSLDWYPFAPLQSGLIHEPWITSSTTTDATLRLQAQAGTPIYVTSFDGQGNVTLLGSALAPLPSGDSPTTVTWPDTELDPGYYVLSYTPMQTSTWVDFTDVAQIQNSKHRENFTFPGSAVLGTNALPLESTPYVDISQIYLGFDPNGSSTDYVPISVSISGMPIVFPALGKTISNFMQDNSHLADLYTTVFVQQEILFVQGGGSSGTIFQAQHANWLGDNAHIPQLFTVGGVAIPLVDDSGNQIWTYDTLTGTITFVNSNSADSSQICVSYWYQGDPNPCIINRTSYAGDSSLTPFDATLYPFIEYAVIGQSIYFNTSIPDSAQVSVAYDRLFDTVRVRADFQRVDPDNTAATPHLYGYTFLARDANGTSSLTGDFPEVAWGDIEVYSLGTSTQLNPGTAVIGNASATGLPSQSLFHWYKLVNAGSVTDALRMNYDGTNGTACFWDLTGARNITPDRGQSSGVNYQLMNVDGSNAILLNPGSSAIVGLTNYLMVPGSTTINPVTCYSSYTPDYLESSNWLLTASSVSQESSVAVVVLD